MSKTFIVDKKAFNLVGEAWKIAKEMNKNARVIGRYTREAKFDTNNSILFHDLYYYFEILEV